MITCDKTMENTYIQALKDDPNINTLHGSVFQPNQNRESVDSVDILLMLELNNTPYDKVCKSRVRDTGYWLYMV